MLPQNVTAPTEINYILPTYPSRSAQVGIDTAAGITGQKRESLAAIFHLNLPLGAADCAVAACAGALGARQAAGRGAAASKITLPSGASAPSQNRPHRSITARLSSTRVTRL
jgi:hypothetical protein